MMPKISVLMGTYNEKKEYVMESIDSILLQSCEDFEFIICDDASEESFFEWLQEYSRKDDRIILIRNEENLGLAATLNRCIKQAKGNYIARMDADDISEKDRFLWQSQFLDNNPNYMFVGCNAKLFGESGIWGERVLQEMPEDRDFLAVSPFMHPTVMFRKEVLEKTGGYAEDAFALRTEDYELFMRIYAMGDKGYNLQKPLFLYREERESFRKRKYCYRINELRVRYRGFKSLGILKGHMHYVIKPLIAGVIPVRLMQRIRAKRFGDKV